MPRTIRTLASALCLAALLGACGQDAPPAAEEAVLHAVSPVPSDPTATAVVRRPPTPTPTPEPDPMSPLDSQVIPGVPIPYASSLVVADSGHGGEGEGQAGLDALAEYWVPEVDAATLRAWFLEQMPAAGWDEGEDRDGTLVFLHRSERAARGSAEEPMRTATIIFDLREGVSFSVIAELAAAANSAPTAPSPAP